MTLLLSLYIDTPLYIFKSIFILLYEIVTLLGSELRARSLHILPAGGEEEERDRVTFVQTHTHIAGGGDVVSNLLEIPLPLNK